MYYSNWEKPTKELFFPQLKNQIKIDWNLYLTLLYKQSPSATIHEDNFANWLTNHVIKTHPDALVERDEIGNIYVTKGNADTYPCAVAHVDINQEYKPQLRIIKNAKWVFGLDMATGTQAGCGHDDKSGCYLCLELLKQFDVIKVVFFMQEEIGGVGSSGSDANFYADCNMIIQQDRNAYAGPELITHTNGIEICSEEFVVAASSLMEKYNYQKSSGSFTDVGCIKKLPGVDCIALNLCAAYYDEHCDDEVLSVHGFENAINFGYELIKELGSKKWYHIVPERKVTYDYSYSKNLKSSKTDNASEDFWKDDDDFQKWKKAIDNSKVITKKSYPVNGVDYVCSQGDLTWDGIDSALLDGLCPSCFCEDVAEDIDQLVYCPNCDSYFNIPDTYTYPAHELVE